MTVYDEKYIKAKAREFDLIFLRDKIQKKAYITLALPI